MRLRSAPSAPRLSLLPMLAQAAVLCVAVAADTNTSNSVARNARHSKRRVNVVPLQTRRPRIPVAVAVEVESLTASLSEVVGGEL